jgi:hypothetical protein
MKYQNKFGYYAEDEGYKWTADGKLLRHFKPLVARDFSPYIDDKILGEIDDSELVDAISNYLMGLNKEGLRTIESRLGKKIEKDNLLYVIPVPHHWSKEANNTMIAAIKKSELVKHEHFDERVTIITDAEAIACYCKKYFAHYFYMGTDQQFMICNVEERSIGITVFKVVKEKDGQNNLILSEVISNGSEESTYNWIDGEFREFIITRFEESNLRYSADGIRKILNFFAREIKVI